ncbi:unnamed protein product [Phaedon cochleariae]|uniref:Uncharacterized protein n=1 Tax=Phaedon cochleariae TaxID=80249 RepID=A0A9N9SJL2_PHACE|nr:unnamed protein product [Phaedon cochleariae]
MSAQESIKCLRYISKICSILGILPTRANTWIYKVYSLTVLSIVFINAIIALKERTSPLFTTYNVIIKAVDQIANGFLTLAVSFATISNVFVYPSKLEEILDSLLKFDVDFDNHSQVMRSIFWSILIGLNAIIMMMLALDSWFWTDAVSLTIYKYYFVRNVQYYQLTLFIFLIFWMAMEVYCRAADLIANGFLTLAVSYAAISTVFVYPSKMKEILDLLLTFDVNIGNHLQVMRSTFWSILICLNASIMLVLALDCWMWIEAVSLTMYKYYFVRNVQYYQLTLFIFLIFWMAMEVYCRFFMLNRFLERLSQRNQKNHLILPYPEIAEVRRLHNQLSFKERTSPLFPTYHVIIKAAEQMANGFLTLAASSATISNVFVSPSKLQEILDLLLKFDIDIGNHLQVMRSTFWYILIALNAIIILVLSLDSWLWIDAVSLTIYKYYLVRNVQYYQLTIFLFLIFWMAMELYCRFVMLNKFLERFYETNLKNHPIVIYLEIARVRRLHNQLCENMLFVYGGSFVVKRG